MMDTRARHYQVGSDWLWLPILNLLVTIGALILGTVAIFLAIGASNTGLHTNFVSVTINASLAGVCGVFPVQVILNKIGAQVTVIVPPFLCDGTVNETDDIGGVRFTLPAGYDTDVPLATGNGATFPLTTTYVQWCTGGPNTTSCDTFNNSLAYTIGNVMYMGGSTIVAQSFLAPTAPYGPTDRGFAHVYYTSNYTSALVTSDAEMLCGFPSGAMSMIAAGTALTIVLIS